MVKKIISAIIVAILISVLLLGLLSEEREGKVTEVAPSITTQITPTETPATATQTTTVIKKEEISFFLIKPPDKPITLLRGREAVINLEIERIGEFSEEISLDYVAIKPAQSNGDELLVDINPKNAIPPSRVDVKIRSNQDTAVGLHELLIYGFGGGRAYTLSIPVVVLDRSYFFRVYGVPELFEESKTYQLNVEVIPVEGFTDNVELRLVTEGVSASLSEKSGKPPFTTKLNITIDKLTLWRNTYGYVIIQGEPRGGRLVILLGNEEVREGGIISILIELVTLPVRIAMGLATGLATGLIYGFLIPGMPVGGFFEAGLQMAGVTPEVFSKPGSRILTSFNTGYAETIIHAPVVAEKKASILLPSTNLRFSTPSLYEIPISVVSPKEVDGKIRLQVSTRPGVDARITPEQGVGDFPATLVLNISKPGDYLLYVNATGSGGELLDSVKVRVRVDDWLYVSLLENTVVAKPGESTVVRFSIVKPERVQLPAMQVSVNAKNVSARIIILEGVVERGIIREWPVEGLLIIDVPDDTPAEAGYVTLQVKEKRLRLFPISVADSVEVIIRKNPT